MRKKHGFTPKYPDVQASTATMNKHPYSGCHYKWNSGSTPARSRSSNSSKTKAMRVPPIRGLGRWKGAMHEGSAKAWLPPGGSIPF
jgi:hypothetical protein